ncbi:MAG: HEAT repeat domain-containing protein [Candidatus Aminicenantia bacterium]
MMKDKFGYPPNSSSRESGSPIQTNLLTQVISEMNIARKKIAFYPPGHSLIEKHMKKLFVLLEKIFEQNKEISLGIAKDKVIFNNILLEANNLGVQEFAQTLFNHGIIFLIINPGITSDELTKFFKRISVLPEARKQIGRIDGFFEQEKISHLKVKILDSTELPIEEEKEIRVKKEKEPKPTRETLWVLFIRLMLERYTIIFDKLSLLEKGFGLSSKELAEIVNNFFKLEPDLEPNFNDFMEIYFKTIKIFAHHPKIDSQTRKNIKEFVSHLSPEKRNKFITKNIEYTRQAPENEAEIINSLFDKIFIEVLKQAIAQKEDLPGEIISLLEESSLIKIPQKALQKYKEIIGRQKAEKVLKGYYRADDITLYQPEEYNQAIEQFINSLKERPQEKPSLSDIEKYQQSIFQENLQQEMILTLLELLDTELNEEEYKKIINEVKDYFDILLMTGRFKEVSLTLQVLSDQEKKFALEKGKLQILKEILNQIKNPDILIKLINELRTVWGEEKYSEIKETILQFGKTGVSILIEMLAQEEDKFTRSQLVDLIADFGQEAIDEIKKRLKDQRWYVVRNMILILRKMEDQTLLPQISALCEHRHSRVKIEALKSLLFYKSPSGGHYLRKFLNDKDEFVSSSAISLAGIFKVEQVLDLLLAKLKRIRINKKGLETKLKIIHALGLIGHTAAVNQLTREVKKTYIFHWKRGKIIKREIYNSFKNYPFDSIKPLIEKGLKSMDREIKSISQKLYEQRLNLK